MQLIKAAKGKTAADENPDLRGTDGKPFNLRLIRRSTRLLMKGYNKLMGHQLFELMKSELNRRNILMLVEFEPGNCQYQRHMRPESYQKVANWVRRRSVDARKGGMTIAAGVILPTLDARFGVVFLPFTRLSVRMLIAIPADKEDQATAAIYSAFGPFKSAEAIQDRTHLIEAIKGIQDRLQHPSIVVRDDVLQEGFTVERQQTMAEVASLIREAMHQVGVRRPWVFIGMRASGNSLRRLASPKAHARDRELRALRTAHGLDL